MRVVHAAARRTPTASPPLINATAENVAQAALQHVVLTYDSVNGQQLYVNGALTPDKDPAGGGSLASWDSTFALALGSEVTGKEQLGRHDQVRGHPQPRAHGRPGPGELQRRRRPEVLPAVRRESLSGIPQTYIEIQAAQYDTYSYLFTNPTFISLDPTAAPSNIVISGMRFGVNGVIPTAGQSYATLNATVGPPSYTSAGGQVLSTVGEIVPVDQGPATDMFFLSFDQFGSFSHTFVEPTYTATAAVHRVPRCPIWESRRSSASITRCPESLACRSRTRLSRRCIRRCSSRCRRRRRLPPSCPRTRLRSRRWRVCTARSWSARRRHSVRSSPARDSRRSTRI